MKQYEKKPEIRWSDLDPNYHVRHSAYYDYGAFCRVAFLTDHRITTELMLQLHIGPILFREECIFKREIRFGDELMINLKLDKARADMSRWTMIHEIWKNNDVLAAVITIDAAWIDTQLRKLTRPPESFRTAFEQIPKTDRFVYDIKQ